MTEQQGVFSIGRRYREKKVAVLDVYRRYRTFRGQIDDGVDLANLERRAKAIQDGRYILAVVGEGKAGKSTFINALLGESLLPTDVLQATSTIVEIFKSGTRFLEVHYADDHIETISGAQESDIEPKQLSEQIRSIGGLQDRFRSIPTALIDKYIIEGKIKPGAPIPFEALRSASKMPLGGQQAVIEEYVQGRGLDKIPVKITIGFPLQYAFDELMLIDSPGVNATGGVQRHTFEYLHNANAILFLHSIESPVEMHSFREFITDVISNRSKKSLFLVLSKIGLKSPIEVREKLEEVRSLFSDIFDPDRILHVDSILKIMADEISKDKMSKYDTVSKLQEYYADRMRCFEEEINRGIEHSSTYSQDLRDLAVTFHNKYTLLTSVLSGVEDRDQIDRNTAIAKLLLSSNFERMERAVEQFSIKAPELQLTELLTAIKTGYENQLNYTSEDIDLLTTKLKYPQTFESEIAKISQILEDYRLELNEFSDITRSRFTGVNTESENDLQKLEALFQDRINNAPSEDAVRKALVDFGDELEQIIDKFIAAVDRHVSDKLKELGSEYKEKHNIIVPNISVEGIADKAKRNAYRAEQEKIAEGNRVGTTLGGVGFGTIVGGVLGFLAGGPPGAAAGAAIGAVLGGGTGYAAGDDDEYKEKEVFDSGKYLENFRSEASAATQDLSKKSIPSALSNFVDEHIKSFRQSIGALIDDRKNALEEVLTAKTTNEEIRHDVGEKKRKLECIENEMEGIREMKANLR